MYHACITCVIYLAGVHTSLFLFDDPLRGRAVGSFPSRYGRIPWSRKQQKLHPISSYERRVWSATGPRRRSPTASGYHTPSTSVAGNRVRLFPALTTSSNPCHLTPIHGTFLP